MGDKKSPGVVLVTKFVTAGEKAFASYIDYIDRDKAVRNRHMDEYNKFIEYMGNPEKTTDLFTYEKDQLEKEDKAALKNLFEKAQENESLMWQTVFSFNNDFLKKYGVMNEDGLLNECKMKELVRGSMNKMIEKEGIKENAIWSAAIHYNTDNIHVHVATTEPISVREKKILELKSIDKNWINQQPGLQSYFQKITENRKREYTDRAYEKTFLEKLKKEVSKDTDGKSNLGNWMNIDEEGNLIVSSVVKDENSKLPDYMKVVKRTSEYVGKWKESSITTGKSFVVNQILGQEKENKLINNLIRESIIGKAEEMKLRKDSTLQKEFLEIYKNLPDDKRKWAYSSNALGNETRNQINQFTNHVLKKYLPNQMNELHELLHEQGIKYEEAYGSGNKYNSAENFEKNKMNDLYKRMGNHILKEMKIYEREKNRMASGSSSSTSSSEGESESGGRKGGGGSRANQNQNPNTPNANVGKSLMAIKRYLEKDISNFKNQNIHKQIEDEEIRTNKIKEAEVQDERNIELE